MNNPIPAGIAFFKQSGIAVAIYFLSPVAERIKKTIPERKMITRPDWYPSTTSTPAKNALETNEVQKGKAYILTTISGETPEKYDVKITKMNINNLSKIEINTFIDEYYDRYTGLYLKSKTFLKNITNIRK